MSGITGIEVPVTERFSIGRKVVGTEKRIYFIISFKINEPVNFGLTGLERFIRNSYRLQRGGKKNSLVQTKMGDRSEKKKKSGW